MIDRGFLCGGIGQTLTSQGSSWLFCERCGHICNWRVGSRSVYFRYGSEQHVLSVLRAYPLPHAVQAGQVGEVEAFTPSMRLT